MIVFMAMEMVSIISMAMCASGGRCVIWRCCGLHHGTPGAALTVVTDREISGKRVADVRSGFQDEAVRVPSTLTNSN